ncbi:hypothetical protein RA178_20300 [Shewanella oncorhynchi]|uniref:Uncharacterized protein n=1 Tax=Shewanella oncorhynchi TaxID=2726434 RepID=A0AA50KCK5_9GAMM|nr:hypothetical protein [Shewanella oncorhynchi]WMB72719.1 hypothetical protein RA178_20300 [Shewanella oncorhynchi]
MTKSGGVTKQFSTVETLQRLLKYRAIMFSIIEETDRQQGSGIAESDYLRFVAEYQYQAGSEAAKEIGLTFDFQNLRQAKILNDRKIANGVTKLWFNTSVMEIFRLCKISLYRPLTGIALNNAMQSIWAMANKIDVNQLSIIPGTDEYYDWTGEINHWVSELLGRINANISKLERVGEQFERNIEDSHTNIDLAKAKYKYAVRLYQREIEPLSIFLDKDTQYQDGPGIIRTLEKFKRLFRSLNDNESEGGMLRYQLQYLDLFEPVKRVADNINIYLKKTKTSIEEHNAIECAFTILRTAYENTLNGDQRTKFISISDLKALGPIHNIASLGRLPSFKLEKSPAFLNNAFEELAERSLNGKVSVEDSLPFEESISKKRAEEMRHSINLNQWVNTFEWPLGVDYLKVAHDALRHELKGFKLPDLLEVGSQLHTHGKYNIFLLNEFNTLEDSTHELHYRVRFLESISESIS